MKLPERVCFFLNRFFPKPNPSLDISPVEYAQMEYNWNKISFAHFEPHVKLEDARILEAGCGLGGGTLYYSELGCKSITGIDIDSNHIHLAHSYNRSSNANNTDFALSSLDALPFDDNTFDVIILRDVFEHIPRSTVAIALSECRRVLKENGRFCISFPPWSYIYASHLFEYISIPWCHLIFSSETLVSVLGSMNPHDRFGVLSEIEHFQELNRVSIKEFKNQIHDSQFKVVYFHLRMIMNQNLLSYIPFLNTYLTSRVIAVLSK